jgi:hypothetical protein
MQACDEMQRFETDDADLAVEVIQIQTAVVQTLERRGFEYSEEDNEWFYKI